ncbi:DUF192 domain-containing protein [Phaeocystidibacter luteus]|uniref:DUF192 domain-containing protein n=1 Tax=Phaeocystidibacter luteus TaxID=911197 RepID=A0A6N6RGP6_9FLAO|nr:DUF192 domain-containing protein [Phaeocystidibacter luteus]KAB2808076.1 DUF192 domain-containing protein [Phaeocystidibacter luteus]
MQAARKIGVVVILLAMVAFVVLQAGIFKDTPKKERPVQQPITKDYEPSFTHEGEVWFLGTDGDTLATLPMEVAETSEEIQYGMMYRKSFKPTMYAMLFLMPGGDQPRSFWMRNTIVPLDIIYINSNREVVSIVENARPMDDTSLPSEGPASFVIEVPSGYTRSRGIAAGTKVAWMRF